MDLAVAVVLVLIGLGAGFLSALLGIGGGIIMVPAMHYGLGVEWHRATAFSLVAIAIMTPSAVWQHARRGAVRWRLGGWMAAGGAVGVLAGAALEPHVPVPILKLLFAGLMAFASYRLLAGPAHARFHTEHPAALLALGAVCGLSAKLLGIGGGLISVPVLTFLGTAIHTAVASSLVPVFTNGAVATAQKMATGAALWDGLLLALGGVAGIPFGARAAHALPERGLKRVFAAGLALAAAYVAVTSDAW